MASIERDAQVKEELRRYYVDAEARLRDALKHICNLPRDLDALQLRSQTVAIAHEAMKEPWDYDNAPTNPHHGGKLTAEQAAERIAQLEAELHAIKYEVMGGEDAPGSANMVTTDDVRSEMERLREFERLREPDIEDGELLPCPFCGGSAARIEFEDEKDEANFGGSCISCKSCGASSPVVFGYKEALYSSWNERVRKSLRS
jgi:Lar family restriction alleviation protein